MSEQRKRQHHDLKTDPLTFAASAEGVKPWEVRKNDRDFQAGDTVTLHETQSTGQEMAEGAPLEYTGRTVHGMITWMLHGPAYGLNGGWCIFSLSAGFADTSEEIEARLQYNLENSCPHCGGSGHKDDCVQQTAREQEGGEAVGWGPKPNKPGRYAVRGFDSSGTEALVCVAYDDGQLVCNLHDSNSDPLHKFSNLMSEISNKFEWAELYPAPLTEDADDLPIVWIDPENIRRTMIASPGETVEVSAYREGEFTAPLYTHPPRAQGVPEEYRQALQDACDIMQADANTEENYGSLCRIGSVLSRLSTPATPQADKEESDFIYGEDCPNGKVQVEFVGCWPSEMQGRESWKPVNSAFIEIYVDGTRYRVDIGNKDNGHGPVRGLHICGPLDMGVDKHSINAVSIYDGKRPQPPEQGDGV